MILQSLTMRNFRNYDRAKLEFDEGVHLITGKNAQGKTNLLESILYLSTTRSHRSFEDENLIQSGKDAFFLDAKIQKKRKSVEIHANVNEKGKNLFIYQTPIKKVSDFIGEFNAVMFCPDDMTLFQASPKIRRRFIDIELSKISRMYTKTLHTSQKLLKERNAYLKRETIDRDYLDVLTEQLIDQEVVIIKQRYRFLQDLWKSCTSFYEDLSKDGTELRYVYKSCIEFDEDERNMKQLLEKRYAEALERDIFLKQTTVGIHKEDFMFLIDGREISDYASQGQKRTVLLAMKIAIVHMVYLLTKEYPVLLLDDVFSELDAIRRKKLLVSLPREVQIFLTTTEMLKMDDLDDRHTTAWIVENGTIRRM